MPDPEAQALRVLSGRAVRVRATVGVACVTVGILVTAGVYLLVHAWFSDEGIWVTGGPIATFAGIVALPICAVSVGLGVWLGRWLVRVRRVGWAKELAAQHHVDVEWLLDAGNARAVADRFW